ncbi:NAC domain-containing protein 78 [Dorcoceras hygrometricum]|uniref:NAC domain-containing protein 78 n=1 Tax=Dorcoceras hygrometricum TaxID=472368 RepID=A0A2Z7CYH3_9LAMI|nr:NAC domain-containing protein 78 [Dorcoceras hygrometricum]
MPCIRAERTRMLGLRTSGFQQLWELFKEDLVFEFVVSFPILRNFQPFVPYPSNPRALFSRELFRRIPVVSGGCFARAR